MPPGAVGRIGTTRWRHAAAISFVAFLPDGQSVLTAASDGTVRIWERATGKELRRIEVPGPLPAGAAKKLVAMGGGARRLVALTKDGKTLATLVGNTIRLWDAATGKQLRQIDAVGSGITALLFAPDGRLLAIRLRDESVVLLDAESGKEVRRAQAKNRPQQAILIGSAGPAGDDDGGLAYSPDGKALASIGSELKQKKETFFVRLIDATAGNELRKIKAVSKRPSSVAFSPDSKLVAQPRVVHQSAWRDNDREKGPFRVLAFERASGRANQGVKLTEAAVLVFRVSASLQAATPAQASRSRICIPAPFPNDLNASSQSLAMLSGKVLLEPVTACNQPVTSPASVRSPGWAFRVKSASVLPTEVGYSLRPRPMGPVRARRPGRGSPSPWHH